MVSMTRQERQLKTLMGISALVYLVVGFTFAVIPEQLLRAVNVLSRTLTPGLSEIPVSSGRFWPALAFSMMMTITALSYMTFHNVRKNKGCVLPLLISKCASALSAICFFAFQATHLAYLLIFIVDGSIFWLTLAFYLRANRGFFASQTSYLRDKTVVPKNTGPTKVVVLKGNDKFDLLGRALEDSGFFEVLEKKFAASGKPKEGFSVVIKPNFMYLHHKKDVSTYTDPQLVEELVDWIVEKGFTNVSIVEAQSTLGNYYKNREVVKVAEYVGYSTGKNYKIIDLTQDMVPYDYGGRLGRHFVGKAWRDADFRVSFAKNKTHVFCHYTLTLKNIYGTLPMQNKLKEYHTRREYDWPTIETLKHFPVHFGIIDAIYSADGQFGVIVDPTPNRSDTIIAGENLMAVDWVGAKKMGLDPDDPKVGRFLPLAVEAFGKPEVVWIGDKSPYAPWKNVSEFFIQSLDIIEEAYAFSDWWFSGLTAMDPYFPFKKTAIPILVLRKLLAPVKRMVFRYDQL